jgi:flagellar biosynthesis protein FliP
MRQALWIIGLTIGLGAAAPAWADPTAETAPAGAPAASVPLKPHGATDRSAPDKNADGGSSLAKVAGSLLVVLGVFFLAVWLFRRMSPQGHKVLPPEAFEMLGRVPLGNRQQAHLVRCGNKILLLSVSVAGVETLTEITDPAEVERLAGLCRRVEKPAAPPSLLQTIRRWFCLMFAAVGLLCGTAAGQGTGVRDQASEAGVRHDIASDQSRIPNRQISNPQSPIPNPSAANPLPKGGTEKNPLENLMGGPKTWTSPEGIGSTLQVILLLAVLSLAPAVLLMTTCFVRIVVVLSLLRQALGSQNLPPTQVITTLSLFLTLLIMTPVWKQTYDDAIAPYSRHEIGFDEACRAGAAPIRRFMSMQIERANNTEDVWLFVHYLPGKPNPQSYDDVPIQALLPAFMLSELKTAFWIGFQIYLPFIILDVVVASVTVSMGMMMLPPPLISLPLKLLLFVLVDGWHLVVEMLLQSFQPFT